MADTNASVRRLAVLHEATHMILTGSAELDTLLHQVLLVVRSHFGVSKCAVFLLDEAGDHVYCRVQNGYDARFNGTRLRIGKEGVVGWVAFSRMPMYVPDTSNEVRYWCADPGTRSELALPLIMRDEILGVLDVESNEPQAFDSDTIGLLALFAGQVSIAIENARLYSSERRRMRQIELINLIARSASAAARVEQFVQTLAELIADSFEGAEIAVLLRQPTGNLQLAAHAGAEPISDRFAVAQRQGVLRDALEGRSLAYAPELSPDRQGCFADTGAEIAVPLVCAGELLGAIVIAHSVHNSFSPDDRSIAQAAGDVAATSIRNVLLAEELRRVANTDFLTGVYNQRYFHAVLGEELARAKRYSKRFALAMLDLREFRSVNAAVGFDVADDLLRRVARGLLTHMRRSDTVCRFAGDRFALILPETDHERVDAVLTKIRASLGEIEYEANGKRRRLAAAYATAHYPQDGNTDLDLVSTLLARAKLAKQQASAAGA